MPEMSVKESAPFIAPSRVHTPGKTGDVLLEGTDWPLSEAHVATDIVIGSSQLMISTCSGDTHRHTL